MAPLLLSVALSLSWGAVDSNQAPDCVAPATLVSQCGGCAVANGGCHAQAICTEADAEVVCECPPGFDGDGIMACDPICGIAEEGTATCVAARLGQLF